MMQPKRGLGSESGVGLVEMIFAMILASMILAGLVGMLIQQHRFYMIVDDASRVTGILHRMETSLGPEFFPLSPGAQDIIYADPDSVEMRVFRGVYGVCDRKLNVDVFLTVRPLTGSATILPDSVMVYSKGTRATVDDDHWKVVKIKSASAAVCPDGTPGWVAVVPGLNGVLSQIPDGAPVRAFRHGSYSLAKQDGYWTLRTSAFGGSRIVGGRLAPTDSAAASILQFHYYDADGNATSDLTQIVRVEIAAFALGQVPVRPTTDPIARHSTVSIGLRNAGL